MPTRSTSRSTRPRRIGVPAVWAACLCGLACGSGDRTLDVVDPEAAPRQVAYERVVRILDRACLPCHGRTPGAVTAGPPSPNYSSCEGIVAGVDGIRSTVLARGSMPPGAWPRLDETDKLALQRWIDAGACAPCNACP